MDVRDRLLYVMVLLFSRGGNTIFSDGLTADDTCGDTNYQPLPPLTFLQNEYYRKFRSPEELNGGVAGREIEMSDVSVEMSDSFSTGITCGTRAEDANTVMDIDESTQAVNLFEKMLPWVVYVSSGEYVCAGALISDQWVLTAAKCVDATTRVILGSTNVKLFTAETESRTAILDVISADYARSKRGNDIGLIKMNAPVKFNDYIRPICVPDFGAQFETSKCYLANWGRYDAAKGELSDDLNAISVEILEHYECHFRWVLTQVAISFGEECLRFRDRTSISPKCSGDTGGPVICDVNGTYFVAGVTSFIESGCTNRLLPDLVTSVSYFEEWIGQNTLTGVSRVAM